jgi:DNA-binding beta-propeller fold protein YncE
MKYFSPINLLICLFIPFLGISQPKSQSLAGQLASKRVTLPNGWKLSPHGKSVSLGDLPLNLVVSPNKSYMVATNNGQSVQSLQLFNVKKGEIVDSKEIPKSWYGLKIASDNKTIYASGGNDNVILHFEIENDQLVSKGKIALSNILKDNISPAGMDLDNATGILYVVTKDNNKLYLVDTRLQKVQESFALPAEGYTCLLDQSKGVLYISVWGARQILPFDTRSKKFLKAIQVGDHPNEMVLTKNGKTLFVANANDNSVSVIDLEKGKEIEVLNAALFPNSIEGSSTNGIALSEDEEKLYIANADNNCLAVFEVEDSGKSKSLGFIPVGWYPTQVKVVNGTVYVANGKGYSSFANPKGPNPVDKAQTVTY